MLFLIALLFSISMNLHGENCAPDESMWRLRSSVCALVDNCFSEVDELHTCLLGTVITQAMVPYTIAVPGTYYLCESVSASGAPAITIAADNVTLNLNGNTITSNDNVGINSTVSNLTITNGYVVAAGTALNFNGGTNLTITNIQSSSSDNAQPQNVFSGVANLHMRDCVISSDGSNVTVGLSISGDSVYLTNVTVINTGSNYGFNLGPITGTCELVNCIGANIGNHAFAITDTNVLHMRGCTAVGSDNGFVVFGGNAPIFEDCIAQSNQNVGFWMNGSVVAVMKNCIADFNRIGFFNQGGTNTMHEGCVANNDSIGFWTQGGNNIVYDHCLALGNPTAGFQIDAGTTNTFIISSVAAGNTYGINNNGTATFIVDTRSSNASATTLNPAYTMNTVDDLLGSASIIITS